MAVAGTAGSAAQHHRTRAIGLGLLSVCLALAALASTPDGAISSLESQSRTLTLHIVLPKNAVVPQGAQVRGSIGGQSFEGQMEANGEELAATHMNLQPTAESPPADHLRVDSLAATQKLSCCVTAAPCQCQQHTFTANSNVYYPPGTHVSGYIHGRYFSGVVQGPGESDAQRLQRRVADLQSRVAFEQNRRDGLKKLAKKAKKKAKKPKKKGPSAADVLKRVRALERKVKEGIRLAKEAKMKLKATKIAGNVGHFHFSGTLMPASMEDAEANKPKKPTRVREQHERELALLRRVEKLEKMVKQN